jgi:hypothetical protein
VRYAGRVPSEAREQPAEDTRVWVGKIASGHEAEHAAHLAWLRGPAAADIFRRRRLTEYELSEADGLVTVVFKSPHTGDPRIAIDFLRYPGVWPPYWEFVRGGRATELDLAPGGEVKVHWRAEPTAGRGL